MSRRAILNENYTNQSWTSSYNIRTEGIKKFKNKTIQYFHLYRLSGLFVLLKENLEVLIKLLKLKFTNKNHFDISILLKLIGRSTLLKENYSCQSWTALNMRSIGRYFQILKQDSFQYFHPDKTDRGRNGKRKLQLSILNQLIWHWKWRHYKIQNQETFNSSILQKLTGRSDVKRKLLLSTLNQLI